MEDQQPTSTTTTRTPQKRKLSEYHDPDYPCTDATKVADSKQTQSTEQTQSHANKRAKLESVNSTPSHDPPPSSDNVDNRMAKIREIIRREFQTEIEMKVQQLAEIDARLLQARHMLDKLRFDVVSEYYRKQEVPLTPADLIKVRGSDTLFNDERQEPQKPLHPAIVKIVGKRPAPMQTHLPERTAAVLAKETIRLRNPAHRRAERRRQKKIREQGVVIDHTKGQDGASSVKTEIKSESEDERPCTSRQALERQQQLDLLTPVAALNTTRLNNKNRFNFVVGNTSKYIGGDLGVDDNNQTLVYKWLVYVQGKNLPQPVETYLKKVRFQLHHSYRPNDIVDVTSPPFQLSKRGWGEFPMRIQLYFQDHLQQKPVQLMHNVVLDKTMCGLHTMGAETVVEVWLRAEVPPSSITSSVPPPMPTKSEVEIQPPQQDSQKPRTISITHNKEELDDNLFAFINKIELSDDIDHIEPTVVVTEPLTCKLKPTSPIKEPPPKLPRLNVAPVSASRPSIVYLPVNGRVNNEQSPSSNKQLIGSSGLTPLRNQPVRINGHAPKANRNVVFQKEGKLYIIDPLQTKLKQAQKQQESLLKPQRQLSLLRSPPTVQLSKYWHILQSIQNDHGYANMSGNDPQISYRSAELLTPVQKQRPRLQTVFFESQFESMRSAVEFLLRRLPLIDANGDFAFVSRTMKAFHAEPALRQRCFEFLRARTILNCMRQHQQLKQLNANGQERYWSVREIVAFTRAHGYTPPLKAICEPTPQCDKAKEEPADDEQKLAHRVQQQLNVEPQQHVVAYTSLTRGDRISNWLEQSSKSWHTQEKELHDEQFIDIDSDGNVNHNAQQRERVIKEEDNTIDSQLLYLPPPEPLDAAAQLVHEMCRDIGIHLQAEQSVPGVSQPLALTLLAHLLQLFVEKLTRRTVAAKLQLPSVEHNNMLAMTAANANLTLMPYDFGRVIAQCAEFDFLGNAHLGMEPPDPPKQSQ